jgi:hypothetical protein
MPRNRFQRATRSFFYSGHLRGRATRQKRWALSYDGFDGVPKPRDSSSGLVAEGFAKAANDLRAVLHPPSVDRGNGIMVMLVVGENHLFGHRDDG